MSTDSQILRVSAARVVSPQDLFSLGLGNSFNFTRQTNARTNVTTGLKDGFAFAGGSSGNPQLDPYRATQGADRLRELLRARRPGRASRASTSRSTISSKRRTSRPWSRTTSAGRRRTSSQPVNAGSGHVYGIELGLQYSFTRDLAPFLEGLRHRGELHLLRTRRRCRERRSANTPTIPGVAKNSATGTLYYERYGCVGAAVVFVARQGGQRLRRSARPSPSPTRTASARSTRSIRRRTASSTARSGTTSTRTSASPSRCRTSPTRRSTPTCNTRTSRSPTTRAAAASSSASSSRGRSPVDNRGVARA